MREEIVNHREELVQQMKNEMLKTLLWGAISLGLALSLFKFLPWTV